MYFITGGIGFLACIIFMILTIIFALKGKSCAAPLAAVFLSVLLFLGSGFLYSRTDQSIGGIGFLKTLTRDTSVPPDLVGEWRENNGSADAYHGIRIFGHTIEIYWVSDGGNTRTLYWAGTYDPPADGAEPYSWVSQNDTDRTSAALLASGDSAKEFTYENGKLSYSASVLGVTTTIEAVKQAWSGAGTTAAREPATRESGSGSAAGTPVGADPVPVVADDTLPAREEASSGDLGASHVEIRGASLARDYTGSPAIVITYAWTNNSDRTVSAMASIMGKAFQNGVQLDAAIIGDATVYDAESQMRDVRPGVTIDVSYAYLLTSDTAEVEFELSELISFSDDIVSMRFDPAALS